MTYYQFIQAVENGLKEAVGEFITVWLHTAYKNNGTIRKGVILKNEKVNLAPTIYLEEYYELFLDGSSLEDILSDILRVYEKVCFHKSWDERCVSEYSSVKDQIIYRLVNRKANEHLLKELPFVPYLDLAIVFYVLIDVTDDGTATMMIHREHLEKWNVSEEEVYEQAKMNTLRLLPDEFIPMRAVVQEFLDEDLELGNDKMYVLTNRIRSYGAAAILYQGRLEAIGMYLDSNYYVIPSSIHEVIIVPEKEVSGISMLTEMVQEVNETGVSKEEVLSDHAYYYDRRKKVLCM